MQHTYTIIYGIIMILSIIAQIFLGNINTNIFAMPFNIIIFSIILYAIFFLHKVPIFSFLGSRQGAIPTIIPFAIMSILVGLFPSFVSTNSFPFAYTLLMLILSVGITARKRKGKINLKNISFWINHWALFLFLISMFMGSADNITYHQKSIIGNNSKDVYTEDYLKTSLPFDILVKKFHIETNSDGNINNYKAELIITDNNEKKTQLSTEVNKPASYDGYDIYLQSYDTSKKGESQYVILMFTHQPWKWLTFIGCIGLILGSIVLFISQSKQSKKSNTNVTSI